MTEKPDNSGAVPAIGGKADRGAVNVTGRKGKNKIAILAAAGAGLIALLGLAGFVMKSNEETYTVEAEPEQKDEAFIKAESDGKGLEGDISKIADDQRKAADEAKRRAQAAQHKPTTGLPPPPAGSTAAPPLPPPSGAGKDTARRDKDAPPDPAKRRLMGETLVSLDSEKKTADDRPQAGSMNDSLTGETYGDGSVAMRDPLDYLLAQGTAIPCVLKTRIVTTYKGLAVCQLTSDVYSANGKTLLMEKGSNVFGEQKTALTQGLARVFLTWTSVTTPFGIKARIDSLGTDSLGASGAEAWVDNHFSERFGGAIMLSFIDDALATASNLASDDNSDISFDNSSDNVSDMANTALENSINIPPTAYVNAGTVMNVLIARDVDFSTIYKNR